MTSHGLPGSWSWDKAVRRGRQVLEQGGPAPIAALSGTRGQEARFADGDGGGEIQFVWGPQPEEIRLIRKKLIDSKAEGSVVSGTTIDWYADNGWLEVEKELTEVLVSAR